MRDRVCAPAGLQHTEFLRLDDLPGSAALGYLPGRAYRCNVLHLPVRGAGDGGAYSTAADLVRFWSALAEGRIVPLAQLTEMTRPCHPGPPPARAYGLGFWLDETRGALELEGADPGISFRSSYQPTTGLSCSVFSNTTRGAWPIVKELMALL